MAIAFPRDIVFVYFYNWWSRNKIGLAEF